MYARGVGIGLRRDHYEALERKAPLEASPLECVDFVEIIPENYAGKGGRAARVFAEVRERIPVLAHGVSLSLGGPDPLDEEWLCTLKPFLDTFRIPFFTEHLSFSAARGVQLHELLPLPFTFEAAQHVAARVRHAMDRLERPILLENPSALCRMPGELDEGTFTRAVLEESGAGLLLDVNNVYVSATNTGEDPRALLASLPLERTGQIHVAGHRDLGGILLDDHRGPTPPPVLALLTEAVACTPEVPVLLEWDTAIPPLETVLEEAARVRATVNAARALRLDAALPAAA